MQLSFVTRPEWTDLDNLRLKPRAYDMPFPEGVKPPPGGGGIMSKYLNVRKACPDAQFVSSVADVTTPIAMVEPLIFWGLDGFGEEANYEEKRDALDAYSGVKILWAEEQEILRWWGNARDEILDRVHAVFACNAYQQQLLKSVVKIPIHRLYTPIDKHLYAPREKIPQIVAVGKIGLEKNVDTLLDLFETLKGQVRTVYVGNAGLWGHHTYKVDAVIEREITSVVDEHIPSATAAEVGKILGESLMYVNMSIYDVGCLSFLEAAMAGCWCICWHYHPMFREYGHVQHVHDVHEAAEIALEIASLEPQPCVALQEEVQAKHSYDMFRLQLQSAVQEVLF